MPDGDTNPAANAVIVNEVALWACLVENWVGALRLCLRRFAKERSERLLCFDTRREMNQASGSITEETNNATDR